MKIVVEVSSLAELVWLVEELAPTNLAGEPAPEEEKPAPREEKPKPKPKPKRRKKKPAPKAAEQPEVEVQQTGEAAVADVTPSPAPSATGFDATDPSQFRIRVAHYAKLNGVKGMRDLLTSWGIKSLREIDDADVAEYNASLDSIGAPIPEAKK